MLLRQLQANTVSKGRLQWVCLGAFCKIHSLEETGMGGSLYRYRYLNSLQPQVGVSLVGDVEKVHFR